MKRKPAGVHDVSGTLPPLSKISMTTAWRWMSGKTPDTYNIILLWVLTDNRFPGIDRETQNDQNTHLNTTTNNLTDFADSLTFDGSVLLDG